MINIDKILVVDNVSREFPGRKAVTNVSFEVKKGSIHGFLGPNGAGKSTTMRMIAGLLPPTSGEITVLGERVFGDNSHLKNKIGLLPENAPLFLDMSVEKYLHFVAKLHGVKNLNDQVERVMTELSIIDVRRRLIGNLSKGYKQRVGLAQALVYDAPFLILDEPTNGLDPQTVVELRDYIRRLALQKTILFSSHILPEVEQLCDQITIIHQGRVRATGNLTEIHKKFRQGLVLKIGLKIGEGLPDLSPFGKYDVTQEHLVGKEQQFHVIFEDDTDCRSELGKYLISFGLNLLTLKVESPELEDIFLQVTETKK
jgi:ABC-2 type transport system ATP-binding protein